MTWGEFKKLANEAVKDDDVIDYIDLTGVFKLNGIHVVRHTDGTISILGNDAPGLIVQVT